MLLAGEPLLLGRGDDLGRRRPARRRCRGRTRRCPGSRSSAEVSGRLGPVRRRGEGRRRRAGSAGPRGRGETSDASPDRSEARRGARGPGSGPIPAGAERGSHGPDGDGHVRQDHVTRRPAERSRIAPRRGDGRLGLDEQGAEPGPLGPGVGVERAVGVEDRRGRPSRAWSRASRASSGWSRAAWARARPTASSGPRSRSSRAIASSGRPSRSRARPARAGSASARSARVRIGAASAARPGEGEGGRGDQAGEVRVLRVAEAVEQGGDGLAGAVGVAGGLAGRREAGEAGGEVPLGRRHARGSAGPRRAARRPRRARRGRPGGRPGAPGRRRRRRGAAPVPAVDRQDLAVERLGRVEAGRAASGGRRGVRGDRRAGRRPSARGGWRPPRSSRAIASSSRPSRSRQTPRSSSTSAASEERSPCSRPSRVRGPRRAAAAGLVEAAAVGQEAGEGGQRLGAVRVRPVGVGPVEPDGAAEVGDGVVVAADLVEVDAAAGQGPWRAASRRRRSARRRRRSPRRRASSPSSALPRCHQEPGIVIGEEDGPRVAQAEDAEAPDDGVALAGTPARPRRAGRVPRGRRRARRG